MNIVDVILSTEVLAGIVLVASLGLIVQCVLSFKSEAATLTPKLTKIESDLTRIREGMPLRLGSDSFSRACRKYRVESPYVRPPRPR